MIPSKAVRIGPDLALYHEAPSLTYFHGRYRYYFDRLSVYSSERSAKKMTGTYVMSSKSRIQEFQRWLAFRGVDSVLHQDMAAFLHRLDRLLSS